MIPCFLETKPQLVPAKSINETWHQPLTCCSTILDLDQAVFKAGHHRQTGIDISSFIYLYHTILRSIYYSGISKYYTSEYTMTRVSVYTSALAAFVAGTFTIQSSVATAHLQ